MTVDEYKEEVERNRPHMLSVARSYLKASEEAEDVVQDVLLKLWQLLDKLRIPMGPLALVLVRNRCVDCLRRLQTTIDIPDNVAESEPACDERYEKVMQLVDKLPRCSRQSCGCVTWKAWKCMRLQHSREVRKRLSESR